MITRKVSPALAAGCTVVLKPSEATPLTGARAGTRLRGCACLCAAAARHHLPHPPPLPATAAFALAELAERAGVPSGALNVLTGDAKTIGDAMLESTVVRKIGFTGSTAVGRKLMAVSCTEGNGRAERGRCGCHCGSPAAAGPRCHLAAS